MSVTVAQFLTSHIQYSITLSSSVLKYTKSSRRERASERERELNDMDVQFKYPSKYTNTFTFN